MLVKGVLKHKNGSKKYRIARCRVFPVDIPESHAREPFKQPHHASFVLHGCDESFCSATGQSHMTQEPPQARPSGTGLDSTTVYQEGQTQVMNGEEAPNIEFPRLQHSHAPGKHHASDEGISHFDDDDAPQSDVHEARQSVGHGNMSTLQASLPVGVSMTVDSSQ